MKAALISLSREGASVIRRIAEDLSAHADIFLSEDVEEGNAHRFASIMTLTEEIFHRYDTLVYVAPCGVAVRAIAPHVKSKHKDPAVLVVDVGARFVVSLIGGHEGGANAFAVEVSNILGAEPVITTTTEARKTVIAGIGCRRGISAGSIIDAIMDALRQASIALSEVRLLASADVKAKEKGLLQASEQLNIPLRLLSSEEIRLSGRQFASSTFVREKVDLPAVAEPAALLAGRRTRLILPKITHKGVTVALARESFTWSESALEAS